MASGRGVAGVPQPLRYRHAGTVQAVLERAIGLHLQAGPTVFEQRFVRRAEPALLHCLLQLLSDPHPLMGIGIAVQAQQLFALGKAQLAHRLGQLWIIAGRQDPCPANRDQLPAGSPAVVGSGAGRLA